MSNPEQKRQFLEHLATQYKFYGDTRTAFSNRFAPENADTPNNQLRLTWNKEPLNKEQKIQEELQKIYPVLRENGCDIPEPKKGRYPKGESPWEVAYKWLWDVKFPEWKKAQPEIEKPSEIKKRCILGLKGNYEQAQEKLSEITQKLQDLLKDKTLSIAKVEKGSIILIVESSQTGYEQIKTLIREKIAGFEVEYVIDEWQDICRRMLIDRQPLTSNTVVAQAVGNRNENRNLIDEDLFVDLALVKPKRSENAKHPQDINPEKGSELFTRQEETVEKRFPYQEFLQEVISKRNEKSIAIIGEPGAGKSTLLQKLAFWLLQETDDLVVWVDLAELGNQPLGEYLDEKWLKEALRQSREEIKADWEQKFKGGAVWLLLDGFDEMSQTDQQALKFRGWVANAQMIVTCRLNLWQANPSQLQNFQTYLTQPFQDEQMQEFIRRWFRGLVEEGEDVKLAESLWSELQAVGKERIKDLCRNPLRLTLLCATWKVDKALPETMAKLYAGFVEAIYKWKKKAFTVNNEEKKQLNGALGELAKASLEAETSRFRLTHGLVYEYLGEPDEDSLLDTALRLGWLNEVGVAAENRSEKVYGFYHATFQEYFAALAVEDWDYFLHHVPDEPSLGSYRIFEPQWKQVILLWLGREDIANDKKEPFIRALVEFKDGVQDFYGYQAYFLAAAGINEFKASSLAAEIVRQVVKWGFGEFDIEKQKWTTFLNPIAEGARKAIPETIRPLAISELIAIIENCLDEDTQRKAADSLGNIDPGNPQAIAALVKIIENTENEFIHYRAAESLEKIDAGNPQAIAALVKVIENTENESTRMEAAYSLRKIGQGNPQAIAALIKLIANAENELNRMLAAQFLGEIAPGNSQAIAALVKLIENTENESSRGLAAYSSGEIEQGNPQAIADLVKLIENPENESSRMEAAYSLGQIGQGNPQAIAALVKLIENSENESSQGLAAYSLGQIGQGNPQAIAALVKLIKNTEDKNIRWLAAESLEKIAPGNSQAIAALVKVIENTENESTRMETAEILGEVAPGSPQAIADLVKLMEKPENEYTRMEVAESLGKIGQGNPQAIAALVKLIENTTDGYTQRLVAAESLGKIGQGNPQAIAALVKLIENTMDGYIQGLAAYSLKKIGQGNPQAIAAMLKVIETTQDQDTGRWAASSLGEILITPQQYAGVVSALKHNLSDEVYQNDFDRFDDCYKVIWNCAENLPYPEFYQAWHHPPTTPHPEVTEQTPHSGGQTFACSFTCESVQHLPIYCLKADILATETRESEIALKLCKLIWKQLNLKEIYPEVSTPGQLCRYLDQLQLNKQFSHRAILLNECKHPTAELIAFCCQLTGSVAIAFLTGQPLKAPLKGFPPNQPNLISAIETWLEEI